MSELTKEGRAAAMFRKAEEIEEQALEKWDDNARNALKAQSLKIAKIYQFLDKLLEE